MECDIPRYVVYGVNAPLSTFRPQRSSRTTNCFVDTQRLSATDRNELLKYVLHGSRRHEHAKQPPYPAAGVHNIPEPLPCTVLGRPGTPGGDHWQTKHLFLPRNLHHETIISLHRLHCVYACSRGGATGWLLPLQRHGRRRVGVQPGVRLVRSTVGVSRQQNSSATPSHHELSLAVIRVGSQRTIL